MVTNDVAVEAGTLDGGAGLIGEHPHEALVVLVEYAYALVDYFEHADDLIAASVHRGAHHAVGTPTGALVQLLSLS